MFCLTGQSPDSVVIPNPSCKDACASTPPGPTEVIEWDTRL